MSDPPHILALPDELICTIFQFCDTESLGRLSRTCRKFQRLIYTESSIWRDKYAGLLGSNMFCRPMQLRSQPILSYRKRCEVARNWIRNVSIQRLVVRYSRCLPWLYLDKNYLYLSKEQMLVLYTRKHDGTVGSNIVKITPHSDDVSKFVLNGSEVVTASRDGSVGRWNRTSLSPIYTVEAHNSEVRCIDAKADIVVSGSRDMMVKIWRTFPDETVLENEICMDSRVLSVAIMPTVGHFVVGLSGTNHKHPLQLFNFESNVPVSNLGLTYKRGAGILDIYPECDNTFLCCGYDTTIKLWDTRCPKQHAASWMDPYDNMIYCIQSDHNVTIVSGANRSGLVHIWDKRKPGQQCIHSYPRRCDFPRNSSFQDSPVYSVQFDGSHLFAAYDRAVMEFNYCHTALDFLS